MSTAEIANTLNPINLAAILEPLIRRIVREELEAFAASKPEVFLIRADSPLYDDLVEIRQRALIDKVKFLNYSGVFNESLFF